MWLAHLPAANVAVLYLLYLPTHQVDLPVDKGVVLLDVAFTGTDANHGGFGKHTAHASPRPRARGATARAWMCFPHTMQPAYHAHRPALHLQASCWARARRCSRRLMAARRGRRAPLRRPRTRASTTASTASASTGGLFGLLAQALRHGRAAA